MCHQSGFPHIKKEACVFQTHDGWDDGRCWDSNTYVLTAQLRTPAVHTLVERCKENSRPFRKPHYGKWLHQTWFIAAPIIPEAQKQTATRSLKFSWTWLLQKDAGSATPAGCTAGLVFQSHRSLYMEYSAGRNFRITSCPKLRDCQPTNTP